MLFSMQSNNYQLLIDKLEEFIRKYYKNQLIRGLIYSVGLLLLFYISLAVLEFYAHFNIITRTILFYSFLIANLYIFCQLIFIPLFKFEDYAGRYLNFVKLKLI